MKKTKTHSSLGKDIEIGAGIAAATAAAIGTYFLYGSKNAAKNRMQVKAWSLKAQGEILERIETLSSLNETKYDEIVKKVSEKYQKMKKVNSKEAQSFVEELKGRWKGIAKELTMSKNTHSTKPTPRSIKKSSSKKVSRSK
jgi:uncharacterized membrane-anchored protein YhcB (DUF1043 family)